MLFFRLLLITMLLTIIVYTGLVGLVHGWDLVAVFFGDIARMNWPGQFNMDFMSFLLLSGLWTMWRNNFSPAGIGLGLVAVFFGILFLSIYLLVLISRSNGDIREILLGKDRAAA